MPNVGLQLVNDRILTASALYPTGGEEAIKTAMAILNHEDYKKENFLQTVLIDSTNVGLMKLQANKINSQQSDIERQQKMIDEQRKIYNSQSTVLFMVISSLIISLALGAVTFYYLRENKKINKRLKLQNDEISYHQKQLIEISEKAEAAHDAKLNFFTNISHEFRTPLTLILAPLEDLLDSPKLNFTVKNQLSLIHKNVIRLLRLVNQLMDFRKIETNKLKLKATENDLVGFVSEIVSAFKEIASKRNIDLRLITKEQHLKVWFDVNMLDKVIFNLLSNAFKFTGDNGHIHIYIRKIEQENLAYIRVEDNGVGMNKDAVDHAFELFFQGDSKDYTGSGLGLALSKELIQLHKGAITVFSEKRKGTNFEIRLPLGTNHLDNFEIFQPEQMSKVMHYDEKIYTGDLQSNIYLEEGTHSKPKTQRACYFDN